MPDEILSAAPPAPAETAPVCAHAADRGLPIANVRHLLHVHNLDESAARWDENTEITVGDFDAALGAARKARV